MLPHAVDTAFISSILNPRPSDRDNRYGIAEIRPAIRTESGGLESVANGRFQIADQERELRAREDLDRPCIDRFGPIHRSVSYSVGVNLAIRWTEPEIQGAGVRAINEF